MQFAHEQLITGSLTDCCQNEGELDLDVGLLLALLLRLFVALDHQLVRELVHR